jgi:hypothetical protein
MSTRCDVRAPPVARSVLLDPCGEIRRCGNPDYPAQVDFAKRFLECKLTERPALFSIGAL